MSPALAVPGVEHSSSWGTPGQVLATRMELLVTAHLCLMNSWNTDPGREDEVGGPSRRKVRPLVLAGQLTHSPGQGNLRL